MNVLNHHAHPAHCRSCKERVRQMLMALYGECRINHHFPWPAEPEAYAGTAIADPLQRIRRALGDWRGQRDFVKSALMPPCDFHVAAPPFIVEFDENQHFTRAREITLSFYPDSLPMGFALAAWRELCRAVNARDDRPADRDERRAWYDTLRDLVPITRGFAPTIRLYAGAYPWCSLDAAGAAGVAEFRALLGDRLPEPRATSAK